MSIVSTLVICFILSKGNRSDEYCVYTCYMFLLLFYTDMEESFTEFKEWLQEEVDSQIKQLYQKALEKYNKIKPFENDLVGLLF